MPAVRATPRPGCASPSSPAALTYVLHAHAPRSPSRHLVPRRLRLAAHGQHRLLPRGWWPRLADPLAYPSLSFSPGAAARHRPHHARVRDDPRPAVGALAPSPGPLARPAVFVMISFVLSMAGHGGVSGTSFRILRQSFYQSLAPRTPSAPARRSAPASRASCIDEPGQSSPR